MKSHPLLTFALASIAIAQVPTLPPLTENSQVIVQLCRRNADVALMGAVFFPERADYFQGKHDALMDAAEWLQDYLPREYPGFYVPPIGTPTTPTPTPQPPRRIPIPRQPHQP